MKMLTEGQYTVMKERYDDNVISI